MRSIGSLSFIKIKLYIRKNTYIRLVVTEIILPVTAFQRMLFSRKTTKKKNCEKENIYWSYGMLCYIFFNFIKFYERLECETIEHTSLKFSLTSNRVWWCLIPTKGINKLVKFDTQVTKLNKYNKFMNMNSIKRIWDAMSSC